MKTNYTNANDAGKFGIFGGRFVPETLISALDELSDAYNKLKESPDFIEELNSLQKNFNGRPTPLTFAERLTEHYGGAKIYLKREDLCHTGAHKLNNTLGQILIARKLGKKRIIAETGAGQHGVAVATVAAKFGLDCAIYMGAKDYARQSMNVFRMRLLGAEVIPVHSGSQTLKDATNEAIRDWVANVRNTHYIIGSVVGPHPYPVIVRDFQSVIGKETKRQLKEFEGKLPDYVLACVGGGSNAMGIFYPFIDKPEVRLIGVEAAGMGIESGKHAATITGGSIGVIHGMKSLLLQDENGQVKQTHSISAGLDYPGVGPEHAYLASSKRVEYYAVTDEEALRALKLLSQLEGILPALETSHALAYLEKLMPKLTKDEIVVVNISGRGDKDLDIVEKNS